MPQKTSRTTRKHGTVTRIKLYADEVRTITKASYLLRELEGLVDSVEDVNELKKADHVLAIGLKYTDYRDNGEQKEIRFAENDVMDRS